MSKSTLTRRALVASTAAIPAAAALGLPAVAHAAVEPDPIFALIDAYIGMLAPKPRRPISSTPSQPAMHKRKPSGNCVIPHRPLSPDLLRS
jgi:hypothetical protein